MAREIKRFIPFPRVISPKVNVIKQLEFELTYYNLAVMHVHHYTTRTPRKIVIRPGLKTWKHECNIEEIQRTVTK